MRTLSALEQATASVNRRLRGRLQDFLIVPDKDGIVLRGVAPSFYVKQLAQHSASLVLPDPIARNEIEVNYEPPCPFTL